MVVLISITNICFFFQSAGSIDVSRIVDEVQTLREELTTLKTDFDALKVIKFSALIYTIAKCNQGAEINHTFSFALK